MQKSTELVNVEMEMLKEQSWFFVGMPENTVENWLNCTSATEFGKKFKYEGGMTLVMDGDNVVGMNSNGEKLMFNGPVSLAGVGSDTEGKWLVTFVKALQVMMQATLRTLTDTAMKTISKKNLSLNLLMEFPLQVQVSVVNVRLCQYEDQSELKAFVDNFMSELVSILRYPSKMEDFQKKQVITLITVVEYYQSAVCSFTPEQFTTMFEMKYSKKDGLFQKCHKQKLKNDYRYYGNQHFLVRNNCMDLLDTAFFRSKNYFNVIAGPPGTGKTESFRDMLKNNGKSYRVLNAKGYWDSQFVKETFDKRAMADGFSWIIDEAQKIKDIGFWSTLQAIVDETTELRRKTGSFIQLTANSKKWMMPKELTSCGEHPELVEEMMKVTTWQGRAQILRVMLATQGVAEYRRFANMMVSLISKIETNQVYKKPYVDLGLRQCKAITVCVGNLLQSHNFNENFAMAVAFKMVIINQYPTELRSKLYPAVSNAFLGPNVKNVKKLINFTISSQIDVIRSPFHEVFQAKTLRHSVMLTISGDVSTVSANLAEFLQTNSAEDSSVCMFSLDDDDETLFGDEGFFAKSMRGASKDPSKTDYIVAYTNNIDQRFDRFLNQACDDNKKMKTTSGKRVKLGKNQTMIFVCNTLEGISPAFLSRHGKAYLMM